MKPIACLLLTAAACFGHPMGNFSINHYSKLTVAGKAIDIEYVIDMAEIPAFQEIRLYNLAAGPQNEYLTREGKDLAANLSLQLDGQTLHLSPRSSHLEFSEGAGGLQTMRLQFFYRAAYEPTSGPRSLKWSDQNFPNRAGWKEIVVVRAAGVEMVKSSVPSTDRSKELTIYSTDDIASPPQDLSADVTFRTTAPPPVVSVVAPPVAKPTAPPPVAVNPVTPVYPKKTPRDRFTELISTQQQLSFWFLLTAGLIAAGLGALHALEPGHGKTVVAAYLVGSRGTPAHAALLGVVVTISHMAGVYLLGAATLYASRYIVPDRLYPWLGVISGISIAAIGVFVFLRHWTGESGGHSHAPGEQHSHWFSLSSANTASPASNAPLSLRQLCMLGITGGIVPCPAALVVLLSAFSLHRIGFGLFLITAFSAGLAFVLVLAGLTVVYAKRAFSSRFSRENRWIGILPMLSSAFMVLVGIGVALSSSGAATAVWQQVHLTDKLVPLVGVILLGLFLGIRHSSDPDHVVAVTTIVARQGTVFSSAAIGLLWGLGHTITIFLVGSAIIIFNVVIPPRLGLSMEFCVACMLIILGVMNLLRQKKPATPVPAVRPPASVRAGMSRLARIREKHFQGLTLYQTLRPLMIGLVHGLAGSAAVALLVLSTIHSPLWGTAYLLVFGFGTVAGMMLMTTAMSMPMIYAGKKFFRFNHYLVTISGASSVAFGLFLVYQIGFVSGLFTSTVHWTPE